MNHWPIAQRLRELNDALAFASWVSAQYDNALRRRKHNQTQKMRQPRKKGR